MDAQESNNNEKNNNEKRNIEHEVEALSSHLGEIPKLKNFAESLQSLYYNKKLNRSLTDDKYNAVLEYENIRDETRNDAVMYLKLHLPKVENLLTSIQTLFEYYNSFFDEELLNDINEDIKESKQIAKEVKKLHKTIKLKERLNKTEAVVKELTQNEDLKTQIKECKEEAKFYMTKAVQHVDHSSKPNKFFNFLFNQKDDMQREDSGQSGSKKKQRKKATYDQREGDIHQKDSGTSGSKKELKGQATYDHKERNKQLGDSGKCGSEQKQIEKATHGHKEGNIQQEDSHHFESKAKEFLAKATALQKELEMRQADVSIVTRELIETLRKYIESVCGITDFFFFLEKDISYMLRSKNDLEKYRERHFQVMKEKSEDIVYQIQVFFGCIPDIRSTIEAVPINANDKNFVDEWLQSTLKEIKKETGM